MKLFASASIQLQQIFCNGSIGLLRNIQQQNTVIPGNPYNPLRRPYELPRTVLLHRRTHLCGKFDLSIYIASHTQVATISADASMGAMKALRALNDSVRLSSSHTRIYIEPALTLVPSLLTSHPSQDIVYNSTTSLWACCYGSGSEDYSKPNTDETFQPPPLNELIPLSNANPSYTPTAIPFSPSSNPISHISTASPTGTSAALNPPQASPSRTLN